MTVTVYAYRQCGTCRKAIKHLEAAGVEHEVLPIREQPPSAELLAQAAAQLGLRKCFNTSGQDYRALDLKNRLPDMDDSEAIALLAGNGNLIKRPFVVLEDGTITVGYKAEVWNELFG
jgi:arsenate reductase